MPTLQESQSEVAAARADYEDAEARLVQAKQDMQAALDRIEAAQSEHGLARRQRAAQPAQPERSRP